MFHMNIKLVDKHDESYSPIHYQLNHEIESFINGHPVFLYDKAMTKGLVFAEPDVNF